MNNADGKRSLIEEIQLQDLYTLHSNSHSISFPGILVGEYFEKPLTAFKPNKYRSNYNIMKKLSVQDIRRSLVGLPALIEEDNSSTSELKYPAGSDDLQSSSQQNLNEMQIEDADESWVDLSKQAESSELISQENNFMPYISGRGTPPIFGNGEEYLRLLREAQKESNQSSARVSLSSSRRDTPRDSPKSPPNSPNTELVFESPPNSPNTELVFDSDKTSNYDVFINYYNKDGELVGVKKKIETDWIWDWSSRPDQTPPKEWKFVHPNASRQGRGASMRRVMVGKSSLWSRDVLYTVIITNIMSLLIGTGIGIWLSKKSGNSSGHVSEMTPLYLN